jgi:5'-3' exonuclease
MSILLNGKPILLIDYSYYVYYRYYATKAWSKHSKTELNDEMFKGYILKHMENDLIKWEKKWKTTNFIMCMDCPRKNIWRNEFMDDYKGNRIKSIDSSIFELLNKHKNIIYVEEDCLEADDVVAILYKEIRKMKIDYPIVIITNDNDYIQLMDNYTEILNMQYKNIVLRGADNPTEELFLKAILGDKSDNIPKIFKISKEKLHIIAKKNKEEKDLWLYEKNIYEQFYKNMKLISFEYIPQIYIIRFVDKLNIKMI